MTRLLLAIVLATATAVVPRGARAQESEAPPAEEPPAEAPPSDGAPREPAEPAQEDGDRPARPAEAPEPPVEAPSATTDAAPAPAPEEATPPASEPDAPPPAQQAIADAAGAPPGDELEIDPEDDVVRVPPLRRRNRDRPRCLNRAIVIVRAHGRPLEARRMSLTDCDGRPNPEALVDLSILARPHDVARPSAQDLRAHARGAEPGFVAPGVRLLDEGLLTRVQAIADRWPGRRIEIVSGYRPRARRTSRHRHGRALDLRVVGVDREQVVEMARTLEATGVGFYPNSTFTHVDVREESAYWVDRSGPGEAPDYGPWPPRPDEEEDARDELLAAALAALDGLAIGPFSTSAAVAATREEPRERPARGARRPRRRRVDPEVERIRRRALAIADRLEEELRRQ